MEEEEEEQSSNSSVIAMITATPTLHNNNGESQSFDEVGQEWSHSDYEFSKDVPGSLKKRTGTAERGGQLDRISAFPDPILQHILSFLTVEDMVKTCVLSKRWRHVWAAVPSLNFGPAAYFMNPQRFASFVDKTLRLYTGSLLDKFSVSFDYYESFSLQADEWVRFATSRHVEELSLHFSESTIFSDKPYHLPQCIYSTESLRILDVKFCDFQTISCVSWAKLKALSIGYVMLSDEIMAQILLGSPMIEFLRLQCCDGIGQLIVYSSNLKELVIDGSSSSSNMMEISAPNVRSISLLGNIYKIKYKLIDMSSLVEANLGFVLLVEDGRNLFKTQMLMQIVEKLGHVQILTLGAWCFQVLSTYKEKSATLCKLKSLTIDSSIDRKSDLCAIASLLESSPELEKLTINLKTPSNFDKVFQDLCSSIRPCDTCEKVDRMQQYFMFGGEKSNCLSFHLKNVEINGFQLTFARSIFLCPLVKFFLNNAKVLEKMAIHVNRNHFSGSWEAMGIKKKVMDFLEVNRLLLSYSRASPNVVVDLENPFN